ncbi:unnamed protein product [marine sediment metagenome]|uniref:Uncharacterized protein n=1 Tax=marine sediment metagenome TaxID=412755 RepID=X1D6T2_9ZZZZ
MTENKTGTKLGKNFDEEENSAELNGSKITSSTDKFDWDFIPEREWSRTKK